MYRIAANRNLKRQRGVTYVEMLITVAITALIMVALMGVVDTASETGEEVLQRNQLARQARFAMQQMVSNVSESRRLLLPLVDNPATDWPENLREQTVPPSPPIGSSTLATAVLAVTLPLHVDLDGDGFADADNDTDGRVDEDLPADNNRDGAAGIAAIDDDGDGDVDESAVGAPQTDNDEDDSAGEDMLNAIDDDADGSLDEDSGADLDGNGVAGILAVDDDADGSIDEGAAGDDDEDGSVDEDWYDVVVFYLDPDPSGGRNLNMRSPVPWDINNDSQVDGADYQTSVLANNVSLFRVERLAGAGPTDLVDITLALTDPDSGETVSLQTRVRVGGGL